MEAAEHPASFGDIVKLVLLWAATGVAAGRDISNELVALEGLLSPWCTEADRGRMDAIEEEWVRMEFRRDWPRPRKPNPQKYLLSEWVRVARPFLDIRVSEKPDSAELMISAR